MTGIKHGQNRVVIENVYPEIDCGRYSVRRVTGEMVAVEADVFGDGHDAVSAVLLYRAPGGKAWNEAPMTQIAGDRWGGGFAVEETGEYLYCIEGWIDHFTTWTGDIRKKYAAGQDICVDLLVGAGEVEKALRKAGGPDRGRLRKFHAVLSDPENAGTGAALAEDPEFLALMRRYPDRSLSSRYGKELRVQANRPRARFSAWYERFPRSCSPEPGRHGTFRDLEALLPEIARMGFDVLYLPPVHPIGKVNRKGKNNSPVCGPDDPGSPWAIGSEEGGHKAVHAGLGTLEDLRRLSEKAGALGMEIALDIAYQCAPDHPYVKEHPEWFRMRPDGTIQYAENPPKKYQDIFPINFESEGWKELWDELKSVVDFWIDQGVRIFRVDNPHTKSFAFWEWMIAEVKKKFPEVIFLSEAFTRPKVMYRLAKAGFDQSYTYFTWRNTREEFTEYLSELTSAGVREYFQPNFWPNTPDILPHHLQYNGRQEFMKRLVLAATLSSSYGIYGPAFELCVRDGLPGREEYRDSEKYEIKVWDREAPGSLTDFIARINAIRKENPALQRTENLKFLDTDNDAILAFLKTSGDLSNVILAVINMDPRYRQSGWVSFSPAELKIPAGQPYLLHDLIDDEKYIWNGDSNYVELDPGVMPAHIFRVHGRLRRESDFDYFT